jgi:pseudouridine synthase
MALVNIHQAKTHLSQLLLGVERGEEVVIARSGVPIARLVAWSEPAQPVAVKLRRGSGHSSGHSSCLELVMGEGRNRQIRRTAALLGHPVLDLQRIAIGDLRLNDLPEGQWRRLDHQEWQALSQPI